MTIPVNPLIILGGQSNMEGFEGGGGSEMITNKLPADSSTRFFCSDGFGEHTAPVGLDMVSWGTAHYGPEQGLVATLKAAGWANITVLKFTRNGQPIATFLPGGINHYRLNRVIVGGRPAVSNFTPFFIWGQGEGDAVAATSTLAQAQAWGANYETLFSLVQAAVGKPLVGGKIVMRLCANIYGINRDTTAPYFNEVVSQQTAHANHLINTDDVPLSSFDILHYTGAGFNTVLGPRYANKLLEIVG